MAAEIELIAVNAADDGVVDNVPSAVDTGYQNQNTLAQGTYLGFDQSSLEISGSNVIIYSSGIIDDSGLAFVVKSNITLALPTTGTNHYLKVVADGSSPPTRTLAFTTDRGTYSHTKRGWYNGSGERILNWVYKVYSNAFYRISPFVDIDDLLVGSYLEINSGTLQSITVAVWTKLTNYGTPSKDTLNEWESSSADRYDPVEEGVHTIMASLSHPAAISADTLGIAIYKNGTLFDANIRNDTKLGIDPTIKIVADIYLLTTDYIEIYAYTDYTGTSGVVPERLTISRKQKLSYE